MSRATSVTGSWKFNPYSACAKPLININAKDAMPAPIADKPDKDFVCRENNIIRATPIKFYFVYRLSYILIITNRKTN